MAGAVADTIRVDAAPGHATNSIRPTEALGAGVDRLRQQLAAVGFRRRHRIHRGRQCRTRRRCQRRIR